jgi:hypothetical protein
VPEVDEVAGHGEGALLVGGDDGVDGEVVVEVVHRHHGDLPLEDDGEVVVGDDPDGEDAVELEVVQGGGRDLVRDHGRGDAREHGEVAGHLGLLLDAEVDVRVEEAVLEVEFGGEDQELARVFRSVVQVSAVAQARGDFEYPLAEFLAHAGLVAEGEGDGVLGDVQLGGDVLHGNLRFSHVSPLYFMESPVSSVKRRSYLPKRCPP